jgi:hypothetical protein
LPVDAKRGQAVEMEPYTSLIQTGLWVGLALVGFLIFRRPVVDRIKAGGGIKVGPVELQEVQAKVDNVQRQVTDINDRVTKLFLLAMAEPMYLNLSKLATGNFGKYYMDGGLERELRHLRDVGYIEVRSIHLIPHRGEELSKYVRISPAGLQFLQLRKEVTES